MFRRVRKGENHLKTRSKFKIFAVALAGIFLIGAFVLHTARAPEEPRQELTPRYGGTLRVAITHNPVLDQTSTTATLSMVIGRHALESLFSLNSTYTPVPHLVNTYDMSPDGTEYVFELRQGVLFHNGNEMTAEDVVASLRRWGRVSGFGRTLFRNVIDLVAEDRYTVRMVLKDPDVLVPLRLSDGFAATAVIMPADAVNEFPDSPIDDIRKLIGTGPYRYEEFIPDVHLKMVRFDDYVGRDEEPSGFSGRRGAYVDTILFLPVPDAMIRLAKVEVGEVHFAERLPADEYPTVKVNPELQTKLVSPGRWGAAVLNNRRGVFSSRTMRQAFLAALDMEEVLRAALGPEDLWRLNPSLMFKEQAIWTDAGSEFYNQKNPTRARQLLEEAGYDGEPIVWMASPDYPDHFATALAATAQLERVGFNIDLQAMDFPTLLARRADPALWDVFSTFFMVSWDPTLLMVLDPSWPGWYESEQMQEYMRQLRRTMDPAERLEIWEKAQRLYYEDIPTIKYGDNVLFDVLRHNVHGYWPSPFPFFWNVWLGD